MEDHWLVYADDVRVISAATTRQWKRRKKSYPEDHMRAEMDLHADTCAFGLCCKVIYDTGKRVSIEGYNGQSTLRLKDIKIVLVAVAYDCPHH